MAANRACSVWCSPAKASAKIPRDVFGFAKGSKSESFGKMLLQDGGCTMKDVRAAKWNDTGISWGGVFKRLLDKGLAEKKKDGMLIATTKARKAA